MSSAELDAYAEKVKKDNSNIKPFIDAVTDVKDKNTLQRIQASTNDDITKAIAVMQQLAQIKIPTHIQLSSIDFTQMQTATKVSELKEAVKLTRDHVMETTQRCFESLPKDDNEIIVMDFDGTLNVEQKEAARGLFGGPAAQSFIKESPERFYILTGGAGEDPSRAYDN